MLDLRCLQGDSGEPDQILLEVTDGACVEQGYTRVELELGEFAQRWKAIVSTQIIVINNNNSKFYILKRK